MSLDLGALVGRAIIDDAPFQRVYGRLMRQMADLGRAGEKTAASTATLDESLTAAGRAATTAGAGLDRTTRASTSAAAAEDKAAAAASRHAQAVTRVAAMMDTTAAAGPRVQAATLRLAAAQERLNELQASGTATTRQLAAAQAGLVSAQRTLTAAQAEGAVVASRWRSSLAMAGRTAAELGLLIGGIEIAKKAIEFVAAGKHLTDALNSVQAASHATDVEMRAVRVQAIALGKDLTIPRATAVDAAEAIDDLVRSGMTLPRAMGSARAALLLAAAANVKTADSARVLGDVLDEFKLQASDSTRVAGILAGAATSSAGGLMAVFEAFTYVGTRARALGLDVKDIAAAVVDLSKAGINGDRAGTGLAMMLQRLADESPKGEKALRDLGVEAWNAQGRFVGLPTVIDQLHGAQQRMGVGSQRFLKDISAAFGARAANAVAAFALRGREGYDSVYERLSSGDVEKAAALMNRGAGAGFRQLGKEATAAGIAVYDKMEKPLTSAVMWVGDKLPAAVATAAHILGPFGSFIGSTLGTAWDLFIEGAKIVGAILGPVVHLIDALRTPLGAIGAAAIGAYLGFKLFSAIPVLIQGAWGAVSRIPDAVAEMSASVQASVGNYVRSMALIGTSSTEAAVASSAAMAAISEEAAAMSTTVVVEGEAAAIGWAGLAGPIGAAAVGVGLLVSMFYHSTSASKEATNAAKAYSDALKSGDEVTIVDAIRDQLAGKDIPAKIKELNKAFGDTGVSAGGFLTAVERGGAPLKAMRGHLQDLIKTAHTATQANVDNDKKWTDSLALERTAERLLKSLNTQRTALSKEAQKDLINTAAFAGVSSSIDKVAASTQVGSSAAKVYAQMMGIVVDKNGIAAVSSKMLANAVKTVSNAYNTASTSGADLLDAEQAFSKSGGTAVDRAALIGATLKSSNGDALSFAASLAATTGAVDALTGAFEEQRQKIAQQSADQQKAAERVSVAQARVNDVRGKAKHSASELASAEKSLHDAQLAAGKAGALSYADTERGALKFTKTAHGLHAEIDTTAKGAGDLVSQLQGIQDAAVKAAGAMFQHERSTATDAAGVKKAADDAYDIYVSKTKNSLIDNRKELGLTLGQARALAKQYFDTPSHVKTLIEAEGANPVVTVLNKIGRLLAHITGQQWDIPVNISVHNGLPAHLGAATTKKGQATGPGYAAGTPHALPGWRWVGEMGPELVNFRGGEHVLNHRESVAAAADNSTHKVTHVHGDLNVIANYPEKERVSTLTPRALAIMANQLGGLG